MNFKPTICLKLFLSHMLAVLMVSGSIGTYFYSSASNSLMRGLKERLQASAALISQMINAESLNTVTSEADITQQGYIDTLEKLRSLKRMNPDISFLYVMRQVGEEVYFVVDSDETEKQAMPGQKYDQSTPDMIRGFTSVTVDDDITEDEWGTFLSGYAPIKNSGGKYLVGIDMRADQVQAKYKDLRMSGIISLTASIALAFLFARFLSSRFIAPIHLAIDRCTAIAAGKLDERITVRTNNELDQLLNAFNDMSAALASTEYKRHEAFEALQRSKDELEIRVRQRTADLNEMNNRLSDEIAQRIIAQKALQEAATIDPLTRLYNRRAILEHFDREIVRCNRNQQPFTVLFVDLDHFKEINDTKGHEAGDSVLVEISIRMKNMLRSQDSMARWGGEEFVVLLPEITLADGVIVAEKIRRVIADTPFYAHGEELFLTASFGVAEFKPGSDINKVIKAADEAVYVAKMNGRNRVEVEGATVAGNHRA